MGDRNAEPSEDLWISFPPLPKVDEVILREAFSPFGEIVKITTFPDRCYAFVRFKNVMAACRAKETLHGKLFGNPRVRIGFAKSETGTSNSKRNSGNAPSSPYFKSYGHPGSTGNFPPEMNFGNISGDPTMRSRFIPNVGSGYPNFMTFSWKENLWMGGNGAENIYEHHIIPTGDRGAHFHDFFQQFSRKGPFYDTPRDFPEDALLFHGAKKLRTGSFTLENRLPEDAKHVLPRTFPDFPQPEFLDKNFESGSFGYKQIPDHAMNHSYGERSNHWNASYDSFQVCSGSLLSNPVEWKRLTPESHQSSITGEWKWEGTIAKGGIPICRACCLPVGKVLDMMLPEFLDFTARTNLDTLPKRYYQAASSWVVFFAPKSDADMYMYNEFLDYLGEKQRAAVAKLDENTTLSLVPPSEFSEKILKVPGKLSISGVVLRLEHPSSNSGSLLHPNERKDTNVMSSHGDTSYPVAASYSGVPSQFGPLQQLQQQPQILSVPTEPQRERQIGNQGNQHPETSGTLEEADADRQKRLLATLQLAAALLKQTQEGRGT
ncbi:flowering time control protein FPA-like [Cornus florida]|uniref:flowering time control protein FPA-like n=1 Tax=Cornus florida TaxID=4283 RepID=UPI002898F7CF|nr:flowering time control protein FPA-like [Cornus florida]XP_059662828.1 flowering time control protein FPA-like [Cornus florida]